MKKKRLMIIFATSALGLLGFAYFAIPKIASVVAISTINSNPALFVKDVMITWNGPQQVTGFKIQDSKFAATLNFEVQNSLYSIATLSEPLHASVSGTVILQDDEPIVFDNIDGSLDIDPGRHCIGDFTASTEQGGSITVHLDTPNLLDESWEVNSNAEMSVDFAIQNTPLPIVNGVGGWSVIEMTGVISSPDLEKAFNIEVTGSLSEYDIPRGLIQVKLQLLESENQFDAFKFDGKEVVGTVDLSDVPTSIFAPLVNTTPIDVLRDLGPTMHLSFKRSMTGTPVTVRIQTQTLQAVGIVDPNEGVITDVEFTATLHESLIDELTNGEITGSADVTAQFIRIVPYGHLKDTLDGNLSFDGTLTHVSTGTSIKDLNGIVIAGESLRMRDLARMRFIDIKGNALLNSSPSTFHIFLNEHEDPRPVSLLDSVKIMVNQLPSGDGVIELGNLPSSILQSYIQDDSWNIRRDLGPVFNANIALNNNSGNLVFNSKKLSLRSGLVFVDGELHSFKNVETSATITKLLAEEFTGVAFESPVLLTSKITSIDLKGNSSFDAIFNIGKNRSIVQGATTLNEKNELQVHVSATGIDTQLLDAMGQCKGLLVDSIGSPIAIECIVENVTNLPRITAGGTAPNATFETTFNIEQGMATTQKNTLTAVDFKLSGTLTQHLLKDFGPVLSDIRTVKKPIQMRVKNANASLEGDISKLNADITIDIGEVELASGSISLQLLPLFNSSNVEVVPAVFDPIEVQIRKGVIRYKEFNLTIAGKYTVPYSGSINLNNRKLNLKSAIPLTGLGYSIKELRGLATDIDVPIRITGTIDDPKVDVDPTFDLGKILQSAALDAVGDAIEDALRGGSEGAPDPLKLLEELFGGK